MASLNDVPKKYIVVGAVALTAAAALAAVPLSSTVASLTDSEFGKSDFSAAPLNWDFEASKDNQEWTSTGGPTTLELDSPNLVPGKTSYAGYWLRVKGGSPPDRGTVSMGSGDKKSGSALPSDFRMRVSVLTEGSCNQASIQQGQFIVGNQSSPNMYGNMSSSGSSSFHIPSPPADYTSPGEPHLVCFEFSLPDSAESDGVNGKSVTVEWTFSASQG